MIWKDQDNGISKLFRIYYSDIIIDKGTINKWWTVKVCIIIIINICVQFLSYEYVKVVIWF